MHCHRNSQLIAAVVFVILHPTIAIAAEQVDCSTYRQGPLTEQNIVKFDAPKVFSRVTARYRQEYVFQPELRGTENGGPDSDILFEIDIQSGQPIDRRTIESKPPKDYVHATLLVQGNSWYPIWSNLPITANLFGKKPTIKTVEGLTVNDPSGYTDLDGDFHGFRKIEYPGSAMNEESDFYIRKGADGEISEYLGCHKGTYVPNPQCELHGRTDSFLFSITFNLKQILNIDLIRKHAETFTACLTQPEK